VHDDGQSGQGMIEYALIIFLVAVVVIAVLVLVGPRIGSMYSSLVQAI
jgi:pilus assembly protein Flp/PilA